MQKSMWLDVVPRAALHYIACVDPPTYSCPMGLGLSNAAETTLENVLKVQQELDDLRATFAEKLRLIRAEFFTKRDEFARKRMGIIAPMVGEGLPLFWLTALRNTPHIWESFTDRDELALKFLTVLPAVCRFLSAATATASSPDVFVCVCVCVCVRVCMCVCVCRKAFVPCDACAGLCAHINW